MRAHVSIVSEASDPHSRLKFPENKEYIIPIFQLYLFIFRLTLDII